MKPILLLGLILLSLSSCVSSKIGSGGWPEKTRDPSLKVTDRNRHLSKQDITAIHDFVWSCNTHLRIFSMRVVKADTILVMCTDMPGASFLRSVAFDVVRAGDTWKMGNYKAKMNPSL